MNGPPTGRELYLARSFFFIGAILGLLLGLCLMGTIWVWTS